MNKKIILTILSCVGIGLLSGCQISKPASNDLMRIRNVDIVGDKAFSITGLRYQALRDAALSVGARSGLASRAREIRTSVFAHQNKLDKIFNFRGLVLDDNVMPPVLIEGRHSLVQPNDLTLRVADRQYMIIQQARFVTNPPTWRDYLSMEYPDADLPDRSLLPRDETEKRVWQRYVSEGWKAGIIQANTIFLENLGRLKRDYQGIILYHTLLDQNMVSKPYVARVELGITGDKDAMAVHDRVLRITALPSFNLKGETWEAQLIPKPCHDDQC